MKRRALACAFILLLGFFPSSAHATEVNELFWAEKYNNLQIQIAKLQTEQLVEIDNGVQIQSKISVLDDQVKKIAVLLYKGQLSNKVFSFEAANDSGRVIKYASSASDQYQSTIDEYQKLKEANVKNQFETLVTTNDLLQKQREAAAAKTLLSQNALRATSNNTVNRELFPNIPAPNLQAQRAVDFAYAQLGKPYVFATAGPDTYDCSGLTGRAWEIGGHPLVHYSGAQYQETRRISADELLPGDLVFYGRGGSDHVSMYVGAGTVIAAPHSGALVRIEILRDGYSGLGRVW